MTKGKVYIDNQNVYEWMCSTGYLLPSTELELARFEILYPQEQINVNPNAVDPFAIINGTRERKEYSWGQIGIDEQEQGELRMAARCQGEIPIHVMDKIKKNQKKDGTSDRAENPSGDQ